MDGILVTGLSHVLLAVPERIQRTGLNVLLVVPERIPGVGRRNVRRAMLDTVRRLIKTRVNSADLERIQRTGLNVFLVRPECIPRLGHRNVRHALPELSRWRDLAHVRHALLDPARRLIKTHAKTAGLERIQRMGLNVILARLERG